MTITFHYSGNISHLAGNEREALLKELETCTRRRNREYLGIVGTDVELEGSYDDEDGYCCDQKNLTTEAATQVSAQYKPLGF